MKVPLKILVFACLMWSSPAWSQMTNFREQLEKANPITQEASATFEEKIQSHQAYLDRATQSNDQEKRIFGFLFLFKDYMQVTNYPEATRCLLEAEFAKGYNTIQVERALLNTAGLLYYKLETATDSATKKMIQTK